MTQEDQLDISHQSNNSVCNQINDDSLIKNNSKNNANVNTINTNRDSNSEILNDCVSSIMRSNMGAAVFTESKEDESVVSSSAILPSSSLSSPLPPSSSDQLTLIITPPTSSILIGNENNKNQNHSIQDNITVRSTETNTINTENESLVSINAVDINYCDKENLSKMTVIKSQNNSENIHEILQMKIEENDKNIEINNDNNKIEENRKQENQNCDSDVKEILNEKEINEKIFKNLNENELSVKEVKNEITNDSLLKKGNEIEKNVIKTDENVKNNQNSINKIDTKGLKRKSKERSVSQDIEDPIARLNALKANISNALREVKAVLIEHGEPVLPDKSEKSGKLENVEEEKDNPNSGAINFRFVKKIRRRSTFDEDKDAITEIIVNQTIDNEKIKEENETKNEKSEFKEQTEDSPDINQFSIAVSNQNVTGDEHKEENSIKDLAEKNENTKENIESEVKSNKNKNANKKEKQSDNGATQNDEIKETESTEKITKKLSPKTKKTKDSETVSENPDKKPTKKKLVKRNSQDDASKISEGSTKSENTETLKKNGVKKVRKASIDNSQNDSTQDGTNSKKKVVKSVPGRKKSVENVVTSALDKVLTTTNLKIPNDRRASVASTQISDQPNKTTSILEKRRSSTSRLILKNKHTPINEDAKPLHKFNESKISEETSVKPDDNNNSESFQNSIKTEISTEEAKTNLNAKATLTQSSDNTSSNDKNQTSHLLPSASKLKEKPATESKMINKDSLMKIEIKEEKQSVKNQQSTKPLDNGNVLKTSNEKSDQVTKQHATQGENQQQLPLKSSNDIVPTSQSPTSTESESTSQKAQSMNLPSQTIASTQESTKITVSIDSSKSSAEVMSNKASSEGSQKTINEIKHNQIDSTKNSTNSNTDTTNIASSSSQLLPKPSTEGKTTSITPTQVSSKVSIGTTSVSTSSSQSSPKSSTATVSSQISPNVNSAAVSVPINSPQESSKASIQDTVTSNELIKSNEETISNATETNQSDSKSPLVRNAITAKLFELKRPPSKMPIVAKSNVEAAKIHPLMVLHITPPKNSSITTFRKTPQNAKISVEEKEEDNNSGKHVAKTTTSGGKKHKSKKVVIRRVKRRLSIDAEDKVSETEIEEKEIQPKTPEPECEEIEMIPGKKSCLKVRAYEPGEFVMYADRIKKTIKWKKATVLDKITSISYKLDVEGEEKPAHISYIKKYTDKKVHFGGKEYLEIDYDQDEESEEEEEPERYNIWARV